MPNDEAPWQVPTQMPDGRILTHMSARARRQAIDNVYYAMGGDERLQAWAEASNENMSLFYRMWGAGQAKHTTAELDVAPGVEDLLRKLDAGEHARVVSPGDEDDI